MQCQVILVVQIYCGNKLKLEAFYYKFVLLIDAYLSETMIGAQVNVCYAMFGRIYALMIDKN